MSEFPPSVPPGGPATARSAAGAGGKVFAFLSWLVLLLAVAGAAAVSFIRFEHRETVAGLYALAHEQRSAAAEAAALAEDLAGGGPAPAVARVSALRARSLELLALLPPGSAADLQAEWGRLAAGLDTVEGEWDRILAFRTGLEALRDEARSLREGSDRLAEVLSAGDAARPGGAEALAITSRQFGEEVGRVRLTDPAGLDRARSLLDVHAGVRSLVAAGITRPDTLGAPRAGRGPAPDAELAAAGARIDSARERLEAVLAMAGALEAAADEVRRLAEASARVADLLPGFEARGRRAPAVLGASLDAWLAGAAALALAALIGLFRGRLRLLRAEAAGLDRAWSEAAESDWRARGLVRDLLRVIGSLDRKGFAGRAPAGHEELEGYVREATASLPRIVARRSRLAAVLLSAHESLRERLAAARDSVLAHLGRPGPGKLDPAPLLEIEAAFREATLFAMAALVREVRAAASAPGPGPGTGTGTEPGTGDRDAAETDGEASAAAAHADKGSETVHDTAVRAFDLLDASLDRVLAGEGEGSADFIFLLDDLRTVRGKAPFSSSLDFAPDLASTTGAGGAVLRPDAARMLPSFRKGLAEWTAGEGDRDSAAKLVRGSVSVLARAAEDGRSPARGFWGAAAAFCTALCERAIPAGPAVRRIMDEVAREFGETAERGEEPPPPERLLRELLIYVALAESDHDELEEVRTAFRLERRPLAVPEPPAEAESADGGRADGGLPDGAPPDDVSGEIIQQLEGIKAALDRIDDPSDASPGPPAA